MGSPRPSGHILYERLTTVPAFEFFFIGEEVVYGTRKRAHGMNVYDVYRLNVCITKEQNKDCPGSIEKTTKGLGRLTQQW